MSIILETKKLKKYYGSSVGIKDVSIKLHEGEIYGFIGPNGAGKSTTIRTIMGLINKNSGEILLNNKKLDIDNPKIKKMFGYLPSDVNLYDDITVSELFDYHESFYKENIHKRRQELVKLLKVDEKKHFNAGRSYDCGNVRNHVVRKQSPETGRNAGWTSEQLPH